MSVLVFCDHEGLRDELVAKAAHLGGAKVATVEGMGLPDDDANTLAAGIAQAAQSVGAKLVLVGSTKKGKNIAARVAAILDWPFAGEAQSIEADGGAAGGGWTVSRMVLSGNSLATYKMGETAVVSVTPGTFEATGGEAAKAEQVGAVSGVGASPIKVVGTKGEEASDFDLSSAAYVVGVGRGFKSKEDIKLAEDLATALPGGAVGCSRPVAADLKWLGEEHWIGLSGHEIRPKVYFAAGVSGQIQHIAGIRGSKLIVAINTNKDAPIFQIADYGIVGDLYKVLPELTKKVKG